MTATSKQVAFKTVHTCHVKRVNIIHFYFVNMRLNRIAKLIPVELSTGGFYHRFTGKALANIFVSDGFDSRIFK